MHAALGLTVSDTLLQGCQPLIVEGTSDQYVSGAIKNYLIGRGLLKTQRELVFVPSGGVRGVAAAVSLIMSRDDVLPAVLLDSDTAGQTFAKKLTDGLYQHAKELVTHVGDFVSFAEAEVEDLFPSELIAKAVTRYLPRLDVDFEDAVHSGRPIVSQIEQFASAHGVSLEPGWKVEIAKRVKANILTENKDPLKNSPDILEAWARLFEKLSNTEVPIAARQAHNY